MSKQLPGPHFEELCGTLQLYNDSLENYYKLSSLKDTNLFNGTTVNVDDKWKRSQYHLCELTTYENCREKLIRFTLNKSPNKVLIKVNDDSTYEYCKIKRMNFNEMLSYEKIKSADDEMEVVSVKNVIIHPDTIVHSINEVITYKSNIHRYDMEATFTKLRRSDRLLIKNIEDILPLPFMYTH